MRWWIVVALAALGCSPTIPEGRFACTNDAMCPEGWSCRGGYCFDGPGDADAGGVDGGPLDGGASDAGLDAGGVDGGADAGGADSGAMCPADRTYCASVTACVDLQTDAAHCGACDRDCAGDDCVGGSCRPTVVRVQAFGGNGVDVIRAATAVGENIVVVGEFMDTVDFGGTTLTSAGDLDGFVASYTPDGALNWVARVGASQLDTFHDVAADPTGSRVVAVGQVDGAIEIETPAGTASLGAAGMSSDGFVIALDAATGAHEQALIVGGDGEEQLKGVAIDGAGGIFVAGQNDFPLTAGGLSFPNDGFYDGFLVRWDPAANTLTRFLRVATDGVDGLESVAVVGGDVCASGFFSGALTLGSLAVPYAGGTDGVVACVSASTGAFRWSRALGTSADDQIHDLDFRAGDTIAFVAVAGAAVSWGSDAIAAPAGIWDLVVGTMSTSGAPGWARVVSTPGDYDFPLGVLALADGRVAASGITRAAVTAPVALPYGGGNDGFIGVWDASGVLDWARTVGGSGDDTVQDLVELRGSLYAVGELTGPVDFGTGTIPGGGARDGYVMQILH